MESTAGLMQLGIIIAAGVVAAFVATKFKLPSLLGYLFAGIILSLILPPDMLHSEWIGNFAQLGAALLLFAIGVEFSLETLKKVRNLVIIGAVMQAAIIAIVGTLVLPLLFQVSQYQAFIISALISTSSTAFVVKMLEMRGELYTYAGNVMIGWLIVQDLMIVGWFLLFQTFAPNASADQDIISAILKTVIVIVVALLAGKYALPPVVKEVAKLKSDELLIVTTVGVIAAFAVFANSLGISFTIGAFLAGLALSESFLNHEIFSEIKPLRNLFMMVFFVSIGSLFNISAVADNIGLVLFLLVVMLLLKGTVITLITVWFDVHIKNALRVGLGIFQVGEFAFLGAQVGLASGWIDTKIYSLLIAVTVVSMALTPLLYSNLEGIYRFLEHRIRTSSPNAYRRLFVSNVEESMPTEEFNGHVILCGHGRVGKYVGEALRESEIPFVVIEMNADIAEKLNNNGQKVIFGDSSNPDILQNAQIESAKVIVIALPGSAEVKAVIDRAKELNPTIKIIARIHETYDTFAEVDTIVEPEFEAAVQIISNLYKLINRRQKRVLETIRSTHYSDQN